MYVRLAFSVATSVDPDILVVDEALSVGDGEFARKSFDRIMNLKARGTTILFCSHSIYQVEALCQRALWLDNGQVRILDKAAIACLAYNQFIDQIDNPTPPAPLIPPTNLIHIDPKPATIAIGSARLTRIVVTADEQTTSNLQLISMVSSLTIQISFSSCASLPCPCVAIVINDANERNISSCCNYYDQISLIPDLQGNTTIQLKFPMIRLLRGHYVIHVYLMCEQAIHIYDYARCTEFEVTQPGLEIGIVSLQRIWGQL
jgi:lipopolysaccharide transport system ATP-binding protein